MCQVNKMVVLKQYNYLIQYCFYSVKTVLYCIGNVTHCEKKIQLVVEKFYNQWEGEAILKFQTLGKSHNKLF